MDKTLFKKIKKNSIAYLFILPSFSAYVLFLAYPLINTFRMSLTKYDRIHSFDFVGIANFVKLFNDDVFRKAIFNTCWFTAFSLPVVLIISILISAFLVDKSGRVKNFFLGLFYLPAVSSIVTICFTWKLIFKAKGGVLNYFLEFIGIPAINWLGGQTFPLLAISAILIYLTIGFKIILFTAAMGAIPKSFYEIADLEGASYCYKLIHITMPLIRPTLLFVVITSTIGFFQTYVIIQLVTGGGPYYRTTTIAFNLVQNAFLFLKFEMASTMGVFLLIIISIFTIVQLKFLSSELEY